MNIENCINMLKRYSFYKLVVSDFSVEKKDKGSYHYYQFRIPISVSILNHEFDIFKLEIKDFSRDERNICRILETLEKIIIKDSEPVLDPPERDFYNLIYNTVDFPFMYKVKFEDKNLANNVIHIQIIK